MTPRPQELIFSGQTYTRYAALVQYYARRVRLQGAASRSRIEIEAAVRGWRNPGDTPLDMEQFAAHIMEEL